VALQLPLVTVGVTPISAPRGSTALAGRVEVDPSAAARAAAMAAAGGGRGRGAAAALARAAAAAGRGRGGPRRGAPAEDVRLCHTLRAFRTSRMLTWQLRRTRWTRWTLRRTPTRRAAAGAPASRSPQTAPRRRARRVCIALLACAATPVLARWLTHYCFVNAAQGRPLPSPGDVLRAAGAPGAPVTAGATTALGGRAIGVAAPPRVHDGKDGLGEAD